MAGFPDLLVGTSAGALNAAYLAGHGTGHAALSALADSWANVQRRDIFPLRPLRHLLAFAGPRQSLCSERGLSHLIAGHLTFSRLEQARIPLHIVTTSLLSGGSGRLIPLKVKIVLLALVVAITGSVAYGIGTNHGTETHVATGRAYVSPSQVGVRTGGWSYGFETGAATSCSLPALTRSSRSTASVLRAC